MSIDLLAEPLRRYIYSQKWSSLRPIQNAAIKRILMTDDNYILAAKTASGKTEAAFLPMLSKVDFNNPGVQVLYISPLIALINDQFSRIEDLCQFMDVRITKWHGEASRAEKKSLLKSPEGVLLITPESIEAMLVNHPYYAKKLFSSLEFIVIDEIHAFIGTERGVQLQSLLFRINSFCKINTRLIGLSATLGSDYRAVKSFTGNSEKTKVLVDTSQNETKATFTYVEQTTSSFTAEFINKLYNDVKGRKVLIFPNSRGKAEELAVKLKDLSEKRCGHSNYFSHHSSVNKELRQYVERFAKTSDYEDFTIVCTSTLELGIDIGSVDLVVQVDSTSTVASLIQRLGRSGRKEGSISQLSVYATNHWSLLQAVSCWLLYQSGDIEPIRNLEQSYDIVFHQVLSLAKQNSGLKKEFLLRSILKNPAFLKIENEHLEDLIIFMLEKDYLEAIGDEYIVGLAGEYLTNNKEFFSVFKSKSLVKILHKGRNIGEIPISPQLVVDENIYLAAKIWKIVDFDEKSLKAEVIRTNDGKPPIFGGDVGDVSQMIRQKMFEVLMNFKEQDFEYSDDIQQVFKEMRFEFNKLNVHDFYKQRPVIYKEDTVLFFTFCGTKVNKTLNYIFKQLELDVSYHEFKSCFEITSPYGDLAMIIEDTKRAIVGIDNLIGNDLITGNVEFVYSKWGEYLPISHKLKFLLEDYFDVKATSVFLEDLRLVYLSQ